MTSVHIRDAAIDAANSILAEQGLDHFSLEAVAERANLSFTDVLARFESRDELLMAVGEFHISAWEAEIADNFAKGMTYAEAYIESMFCEKWPTGGVFRALISAMMSDQRLLETFRPRFDAFENRLRESGLRPGVADVILLVSDGVVLNKALDMSRMDAFESDRIKAQLLAATRPSEDEILFGMFSRAMEAEASQSKS